MPNVLPLLALTGCAPAIEGIWQFSVDVAAVVEPSCQENVSHNFSDARVVSEEAEGGPWIETGEEALSDEVFFGLITSTAPDAATLVVGDEAFPGLRETDGAWVFSWTDFSTSAESATYQEGYAWSATADEARERGFTLTFEDDALQGTRSDVTTASYNWSESDSWSGEQLAPYLGGDGLTGQIPAGSYLEVDDWESGGTVPASNRGDVFDCSDAECALNRLYTCTEIHALDAVRTSLSTGEDYEGVSGAGQEPGY